ncbi:hypothetical protein [Patulibacter minatonensis]|uniref:hypothetical protein n=1 Tax=Patulibacter minatonensis TaxID=298163 RepID=UPI00047E5088|nr:hypothetical protein [Patulibacter minatonensis]
MSYLTIAWEAPYNIGFLPQDPNEVFSTVLTVGWTAKAGGYVLPYDTADLTQKPAPAEPEPEVPPVYNPPETPAPAPPGAVGIPAAPVPALPASAIRPAPPVRALTIARVNPVNYRSSGIRVRISVAEKARVVVHVEARMKKRLSRRRSTTVLRRLTRQRAVTLKPGTTALRLRPSAAGRQVVGRRSRVRASLVVSARYADGRRSTTRRTVTIAPPPAKK